MVLKNDLEVLSVDNSSGLIWCKPSRQSCKVCNSRKSLDVKFPFPVLLCDIGGTNARFAVVPASGAPLKPGPRLKTKDFPGLEDALAAVFEGVGAKPRSLIACAAGPVSGHVVKMTNADWTIDGADVAAKAGLDQGLLLNDFEAQTFSLPVLEPAWVQAIGAFAPKPGAQLIMGLGTGLGVAALLETETRHFALASEAGHMGFGPLRSRRNRALAASRHRLAWPGPRRNNPVWGRPHAASQGAVHGGWRGRGGNTAKSS